MRQKINYLVMFSLLLLMLSCKKKLEESPYSSYSVDTYFTSVDRATQAVLGVYESMSDQTTYGFYVSLVFDIDSDIGLMEGTGLSNDNRTLAHYNVTPSHNYILSAWTTLYDGINRANLVIAKVPEMDLYQNGSDSVKQELNRILGEARFLRGLYYFDLVRFFGDVPLKLKYTEASDDLSLYRTDRDEVYDQIIEDMKFAETVIPWNSNKTSDERVSKGAVMGILARVYLGKAGYSLRQNGNMERPSNYKDYYDSVIVETSKIMASGEHSLNTSYEQVFRNYCSLVLEPQESMFEVAFYNATGGSEHSGYIGTWNSPVCDASSSYGRANSFYKTTPLFYNSFAANDLRRDVSVATFQILANDSISQYTGSNVSKWAPGKWRRNWQGTSPKDANNTDINWVLLRYSDVLLMRAEAENEYYGAPTQVAYDAINAVRARAGLDDLVSGLSQEQFFDSLKVERGHELAFEGFRKFDLIRWNILGTSLRAAQTALIAYRSSYPYIAGTYFVDGKHELYPIPQNERDLDPNLTQNPGY
ncbi:MAG: RagB/SusD family nutrient uptake outer membrane protein [Niabella sp.]